MRIAVATGMVFLGTARAAIRAANTFLTALLCLIDIESRRRNNDHKNRNYNEINHQEFAPLNAYSLFRSLLVFAHM